MEFEKVFDVRKVSLFAQIEHLAFDGGLNYRNKIDRRDSLPLDRAEHRQHIFLQLIFRAFTVKIDDLQWTRWSLRQETYPSLTACGRQHGIQQERSLPGIRHAQQEYRLPTAHTHQKVVGWLSFFRLEFCER